MAADPAATWRLRVLAISGPLAAGDAFATWLDALADAGVDAVQLRDKTLDDLALYRLVCEARRRLPERCRVVVNRRADLALAAGADGVHLPAAGLPIAAARAFFRITGRPAGRPFLVGRSTHRPEEVAAAAGAGADYVTFGPVFSTPSKAAYGPPPGLTGLRRACGLGVPVVALGGIDAGRVAAVATAGAAAVAAIRACGSAAAAAELVLRASRLPGVPTPVPAGRSGL